MRTYLVPTAAVAPEYPVFLRCRAPGLKVRSPPRAAAVAVEHKDGVGRPHWPINALGICRKLGRKGENVGSYPNIHPLTLKERGRARSRAEWGVKGGSDE